MSNDIERLLEEIRNVQGRLSDLPDDSLEAMEQGLRDGVAVLVKCEEASEQLESKMMEYREELEVQGLMRDLLAMRTRIAKLMKQAREGLVTIQNARAEATRQSAEIEDQKVKIAKLDRWLESIDEELKASNNLTETITEEDIIKYIEVYERYMREYKDYESLLKSITVISEDKSSQLLREKLNKMQKTLENTNNLVVVEVERLRQVLLQIRYVPEPAEDDISQTDRTIDSTSMPEEIVEELEKDKTFVHGVAIKEENPPVGESFKEKKEIKSEVPVKEEVKSTEIVVVKEEKPIVTIETQTGVSLVEETPVKEETKSTEIVAVVKEKPTTTIETQTGTSLASEVSVADKSVICQPEIKQTQDVSITCAPPQDMEVQTGEVTTPSTDILENIQIRQTVSEGHETIEIASRPVVREQKIDEKSLLVNADYKDGDMRKDSQLNITHSTPQSFEAIMVEPDETTTEVVVDADGTKRIIVKKVRKTLVHRQQALQSQKQTSHILSADGEPIEQSFSQITLKGDKGSTSTMLDGGGIQHTQYQTYGGQVISGMPGGELSIQEFTSKPEMTVSFDMGMSPEEILKLAEGQTHQHIQTSSSSVTAVVQQVTKKIIRTRRRIIRKVVIIDGKEHVTEEVIEEPDNVEVFEEQIPRVSISVKDRGDVEIEEVEDPQDKDPQDKSPRETQKPEQENTESSPPPESPKPVKDADQGDLDKSLAKEEVQPEESTTSPKDEKDFTTEFIQQESHSSEQFSSSPRTVHVTRQETFTEKRQSVPKEETESTQIPLLEKHIQPLISQSQVISKEMLQSSMESSSSNIATVVQKVTRKITRNRRRIIRHIQVIDGKEHVTEEVIEEPDDVEIIEEEPQISHTVQEQGVKTRRIRIIRQVQIIDGKEHVTEQVVEEPDDEFTPDSTVTTQVNVKLHDFPTTKKSGVEFTEIIDKEPLQSLIETSTKDTQNITDITRNLIESEADHTISYITKEMPEPELKQVLEEQIKTSPLAEKETVSTTAESEHPVNKLMAALKIVKPLAETTDSIQPFVEETTDIQSSIVEIPKDSSQTVMVDNTIIATENLGAVFPEVKTEKVVSISEPKTKKIDEQEIRTDIFSVKNKVEVTDSNKSTTNIMELTKELLEKESMHSECHVQLLDKTKSQELEQSQITEISLDTQPEVSIEHVTQQTESFAEQQSFDYPGTVLEIVMPSTHNITDFVRKESTLSVTPPVEAIKSVDDVREVKIPSQAAIVEEFVDESVLNTAQTFEPIVDLQKETAHEIVEVLPETSAVKAATETKDVDVKNFEMFGLNKTIQDDAVLSDDTARVLEIIEPSNFETTSITEIDTKATDVTNIEKFDDTAQSEPKIKYDINLLLDSERQHSEAHIAKPNSNKIKKPEASQNIDTQTTEPVRENQNIQQTVDISMSITKTEISNDKEVKPKVQFDLKMEGDRKEPFLVKKEIDVNLPSDIKVVRDQKTEVSQLLEQEKLDVETSSDQTIKDRKRSKKKKIKKGSSEAEIPTDKSLTETDSSSLSHYVELPTSPPVDSPKPTETPLPELEPVEVAHEPLSSAIESESHTEEHGYEPEESSLGAVITKDKSKKKHKRKPHEVSEETNYPQLSTTESEETSAASPHADTTELLLDKTKSRKKKGKKKTPIELQPEVVEEIKPISPKLGSEVVETSPRDESIHSLSDASVVGTVKIVEECIQSSPETIQKEVPTTLTYPVSVVEEIHTQEYSVQTSPELSVQEAVEEKEEIVRPETVDSELQTTPTFTTETVVQTTPVEDKEAHTQTIEEIVAVVEKTPTLDSEIQTSRSPTPEKIIQTEVTTQVVASEFFATDDKMLQTSPTEEPVLEKVTEEVPTVVSVTKEIQTSPIPRVEKVEKCTEITIQTTETDIQTDVKEITDQETSTTPIEVKENTEISVQTPEIPLVTTSTQSEEFETSVTAKPVEKSQTMEQVIEENKPIVEEPIDIPDEDQMKKELIEEVITEEQVPVSLPLHQIDEPVIEEFKDIKETRPSQLDVIRREVIQVDSTQQTSPRTLYSEDSISTSTDEPYEVHLRAQISIPQSVTDLINNERQAGQTSPIIGEKQKHKKRKNKKKADMPQAISPESLSDPLTTELSMSITPTSDDLSSKESSSIDEGLASPVQTRRGNNTNYTKLTYSDVVQRSSKSKSPSPAKTWPKKSKKARLLDAVEKRTQSIQEPEKIPAESLAVALIEPSVEKSYGVLVNHEIEELRDAVQSKDSERIEHTVTVIIETISIWVEEIQYKIQRETIKGNQQTQDVERMQNLQRHINSIKEIIEETEVSEEIITLIETLTRQVNAVSNLSRQSSSKQKENESEWNKFLQDTDNLGEAVEQVKSTLDDLIMSEAPTKQKLEKLDELEIYNADNLDSIVKLFRTYRIIVETNPKRECPAKLFDCDDDTKHVDNCINNERDRLLQLSALVEEYEQTLQDFGHITDVAEALLDDKIIVSNLQHLHEEIQKHRKFFVNLSHCRAILESLEDNLDNDTRAKYTALHTSLHDRATNIIDRAASRAQHMTLAASRWSTLEHGMKEEQQWLGVAQQRIPDLSNVTTIDHEQYINLYQSISVDVSHHHAKILRLMSITESLQNLIVCSGLDTECSIALDTLLKLQEEIDTRLIRLTAFKENWLTYDHLVDKIEGWVKIAKRELKQITPETITTTGNLRRFWELKAQHEVYNNLKNECGIQFEKALEILPVSDEMLQRQFFSNIEDEWRDLSSQLGEVHQTAIQNISDRDVSSGEKLNILEEEIRELRSSLDGLKGVIKSDDELNLYIERLQVMTSRIDRIQSELSRLSLLPTAESDRLGALLSQSRILDDLISEELERSLLLKEKIVQVQAGINRCQKNQRRARLSLEECEAAERLGSDVVEKAAENCERLLQDLTSQWNDILALRQALHTLPTSLRVSMSPTGIEKEISALQDTHSELETACHELNLRLRTKVQLWRRFERQLEMVQGAVREADYMVELLTVQGQVDYDRLLKATEKLETLSESLSRRSGELVGELRDAAGPLESTTEPTVAAQLKRELDEAATAYEHTCSNLTQLCDKYHKAVDLWKRYRDAAATVRAFAEFQEGRLHALRPDDAPATAQACSEQESRVAELRSLAARVADETGSRALQADADALARRLQLVAGAVRALADLGEARQVARAKANHAKDKLCDMRHDLAPLHEDGEIVEDKLIALRDNLIALGRTEGDIAPARADLPAIDRDVSDEHSIVRILELWQAMFRDTFLHYHRLSTALIRSGDAATALKLWHEYLLDLQSFLSSSVPADYENLTEHRRLCRVHRNLLASQRSVLMMESENRETRNRHLADKFDTLTNLHNETLAQIVDRHDEVCTRIAAWDDYREINTEILRWLNESEREKEKLQLRYVHIKTIHKILSKIQNLLSAVPEGRKQTDQLFVYLKKVLEFTEETYGTSVRMEYAGVVKRVDNLQASLETWRDFLTRILALVGEYETITADLYKLYSKTQNEIHSYSDEARLSRPELKKAIEKYTSLRNNIEKTETQIEALSVIQEQLKECLSPQDIRVVNQRIWQLRQQRADLEHQLSIIIHRLQERLEIYTIFDSRLTRFSEWLTTVESRLESSSRGSDIGALDPQDLIRKITSEVQSETALKEREFEWLSETGEVLVELSKKDEKSYSKSINKQLKDVHDRWYKLQETGQARIDKINELLETILQLEERLTEIRLKLHSVESRLTAPVILEQLTTNAIDEKFAERDEIHRAIEQESVQVGETLNLCELIFNDPDVIKGNFDLRNLRTGVDIVEKKWKNICDMSEQRNNTLKEIRKSAETTHSLLPKVEKKLNSIEKRVEKIETRKQRGDGEDESVSKAVIKELDSLEENVKEIEVAYGRVASARSIELRGQAADDAARLRSSVRRWQLLRSRVDAAGADTHRQFVAAHGKAVVALAEADVKLTRALHLAPVPQDKAATLMELEAVESDLVECRTLVEEADRLSSAAAAGQGVAGMAAEYRALYADVLARLEAAKIDVVADVDSAVQVDTLKWETDASLQVDTLTAKETYRSELIIAVKETSEALEELRVSLLKQYEGSSGDELATAAKDIAKAGTKPAQPLELAKHLSELLLTECDATEVEAMLNEVESLALRYEDLLAQAKKRELQINNLRLPHSASYALTCEHETGRLTCPLCSERNWKQLDNDLWRLEQWLQFAEATEAARNEPPEVYEALEDAIQDHREFLLDLDSHKSIVVSLNVVGAHVAAHASSAAAASRLRERLAAANKRWDAACEKAAIWQKKLQRALVHNQQFHDIVVELVAQLAAAEKSVRSRSPLRLTRPPAALRRDWARLEALHGELRRAEPRVLALHDAAQLLRAPPAPPRAEDICRRLGELRLRLQSLRKLSSVYSLKLGAALARQPGASQPGAGGLTAAAAAAIVQPAQLMDADDEQISSMDLPPLDENDVVVADDEEDQDLGRLQRGLRFISRVARASLPFQALLLLLLGAAALAPHAHSDCRQPGLALEPVLRYPDGPPPL